jgi:hypothetical protein
MRANRSQVQAAVAEVRAEEFGEGVKAGAYSVLATKQSFADKCVSKLKLGHEETMQS